MESIEAVNPVGQEQWPKERRRRYLAVAVTAVVALWLFLSPAAEAKKPPPPAQRTYFVILLGVEGGYESGAECMRFDRRRLCSVDAGVCGSWEYTEIADYEIGLSFRIEFTEDETGIVIDGSARVEDRFKRSSFGGAATISVDGQVGNFALVGREVPPAGCPRLAEAFNARAAAE